MGKLTDERKSDLKVAPATLSKCVGMYQGGFLTIGITVSLIVTFPEGGYKAERK